MNWGRVSIDERSGTLYSYIPSAEKSSLRYVSRIWAKYKSLWMSSGNSWGPCAHGRRAIWRRCGSIFCPLPGMPCITPPFGTMSAIDQYSSADVAGTDGLRRGYRSAGSENPHAYPLRYARRAERPTSTASGLILTLPGPEDNYLRALDPPGKSWPARFPYCGWAGSPANIIKSPKSGKKSTWSFPPVAPLPPDVGDDIIAYALEGVAP